MAKLWYPDTCRGGQCVLDIVDGHAGLNRIIQTCAHHEARRAGNDSGLFTLMLATNRVKNYALAEAASETAREATEIPWAIDEQDRVVITSGLNAQRRTRLQSAIDTRLGAGKVVVQ